MDHKSHFEGIKKLPRTAVREISCRLKIEITNKDMGFCSELIEYA